MAEYTKEIVDSLIKHGKFTYEDANNLLYDEKSLSAFRGVLVRVYSTENYVIYRPLERNRRVPEMYCFLEIENFFLKRASDDPNVCYFGSNNFDSYEDKELPIKIFKN